jgi:hypothetical protein
MKHEQIWAGCIGKATYDSKAAALKCLRFRKTRLRSGSGRGHAQPYRCTHCHGWHIGSVSSRQPGLRR